ncbi:uncharacterized protein A4U43_C10F11540 [Asparagus officinalis]|uniref:N-acetyltransferase domain-containing protein n=1 Tax=Asparagus officinalis TaxID=4686 RepID=A0A5P1E2K3_ASPOF|nr:uncharacterized protein LOC109825185 [Asparagus officinalis]ONK56679.1 uncharacterized protein A4U43_C10F11540 [Asparagus officinalis]
MASCLKTTPIFYPLTNSTKSQVSSHQNRRWKISVLKRNRGRAAVVQCSATASDGELRILQEGLGQNGYLTRGFGWGVRRMERVEDEMRRVADVQAEAFHEPAALFNDFFFEFFKAEVLSALIYRIRNSPPDRYACLVTESINNESNSQGIPELVGVVDVTVQREDDVLQHLQGAREYLYVSGIAVLIKFRRQKIATVLLEACNVLSEQWGYEYLALRAHEDDSAAQRLYTKAGYRVVSRDPHWITWVGKKRRVLMIKHSRTSR